jgi:hypothetical protein
VKTRLAAVPLLVCVLACSGSHSPTETGCKNISGTYNGSFAKECAGSDKANSSGVVTIEQTGCNFSFTLPGDFLNGTMVTGTISGSEMTLAVQVSELLCSGTVNGSATIGSNGTITGSFSGALTELTCCSPISGSFTLTK